MNRLFLWLKIYNNELYLGTLIIVVAFSSFGLGRLSRIEEIHTPVTIFGQSTSTTVVSSTIKAQQTVSQPAKAGQFVASRTGSAYYFPWCAAVKRIKDENKI